MTQTLPTTKPDVDLADGRFYSDGGAREAYRWMRANEPVFRDRNGQAAATTYQAVLDAERTPELFSNAGGIRPDQPGMPYMIDMDDPAHLLRRKLVNSGFTRKRVMDKVPSIVNLCDTLIDAVCERGECDFVRDIAAPLPMAVIGDMLGVLPSEREMLLKWSDDLVCGLSSHVDETVIQNLMETFAAYTAFTKEEITKRRADPSDDLFSILVNAEVEGQRMSDDEIVFETLLILIGGDETTRHTLSGGVEQLLRNHDQWETLVANPDALPSAIEEMLRWTSPVKNMCRTLTADTTFHGTDLKEGEKIMLMFESANFDEAVFENPDEFRIDRNPNSHLAFGFGTHFCLGNQLARLELKLMVERLLARLPDLRLADGADVPLRPANFVSGPEAMPVVFTPTARVGA
ncbi:cytochrome P450 [Mycolicibacterium fortuitum]|uniref:Steroid C26-monooxygenase n=2 Tax=Mycolicibacterium fortuitum TaxID=1766 RepID=A0A378V215_MYCFO|nr:cytochrome P450 [Mycolicibacterium fortuitum]AIY45002.1 Cytochrome P450 [Mycobacterium sp. VKM Ac-1817D]CRL81005.1 cytochrome P450 [Mycolicibacter nonchromogenicus]EJZ16144.1 cytochrome P450 [Mycolicibacterium fortuitum subsp. fortuitum DSM 46621 = ATCC 6841 = JCM 6387]MBP3082873.1 cytochrome P450 [Mycolicibacterium fortuitum]MCA4726144.1 cytochrome P450 [Mycolicibacterium fortuitum]